MNLLKLFLFSVGITCIAIGSAQARETDQFSTWGKELSDASPVLDSKINSQIAKSLEKGAASCAEAEQLVFHAFWFHGIWIGGEHEIEVFAEKDPSIARIKTKVSESLYKHAALEPAFIVGLGSTVNIGGIYLGTDKFSHFFRVGWEYLLRYRAAIKTGTGDEEAVAQIVGFGVKTEKSMLGLPITGVFSYADLEANYQGFLFYHSLCESVNGRAPMLQYSEGAWRMSRPFRMADYANPNWDESYNLSGYTRHRLRTVKPMLEQFCSMRSLPGIMGRFESYGRNYSPSESERILLSMSEQGQIPRWSFEDCDR